MTTISREDMAAHVANGRARRWTHTLGPDRAVPEAAELDGAWFVVPAGSDRFQPAAPALATSLTAAQATLERADAAQAALDATDPASTPVTDNRDRSPRQLR
ncbi:hypothetical protein [Amycolatopsis tolypomycina]|uniref:hypothetical protein n=1 Tax=Amycolatopsis tolypomycina TaxID=208445 RepID=UPI0033BF9D9B